MRLLWLQKEAKIEITGKWGGGALQALLAKHLPDHAHSLQAPKHSQRTQKKWRFQVRFFASTTNTRTTSKQKASSCACYSKTKSTLYLYATLSLACSTAAFALFL
jgi:hypothetical protein